ARRRQRVEGGPPAARAARRPPGARVGLPGAAARDRGPVRPHRDGLRLVRQAHAHPLLPHRRRRRADPAHPLRDGRVLAGRRSGQGAARRPRRRGAGGAAHRRADGVRAAHAGRGAGPDDRRGPGARASRPGPAGAGLGRGRGGAPAVRGPRPAAGGGPARPAEPRRDRQPLGRRDLLPARRLAVDPGARGGPAGRGAARPPDDAPLPRAPRSGHDRRHPSGQDALGLRPGRAPVPPVRDPGGVPGQRDGTAVRPRDLVVPALPAGALPDARAATDPPRSAPGRQRGVVRVADPADGGAAGVRTACL
ncbi:MAG: Formamidopyrimidine-DNA glycosylase, partial [uncultured Frankineae bacterium]